MKSEMDLAGMDERQRLCWLLASRATLLIAGLIWIGMIVFELANNRTPVFMIAAVPAIALIRWVAYLVYKGKC